ncbi:MAG: hypothetical protein EOP84_00740 [Verrucomicrobiaceae bacterium]|nr:MAG: hypothetical protein EOP84_00740 [Verrucomicrobiaceae bacterium]
MNSPTEDQAPNHEEEDSRVRLIRQVVEILGDRLSSFVGNPLPSDAYTSVLFERAEFLLNKAEVHHQRRIHAYRLFQPNGAFMTAREIEKRFDEVGWRKSIPKNARGTGHVTIRKNVIELLSQVEAEVQRRQELSAGFFSPSASGLSFSERLDAEVVRLIHRLSLAEIVPDVPTLMQSISWQIEKLLDGHRLQGRRNAPEDLPASLAMSRFMKFVCGCQNVEQFKTMGESQTVRPYELFLFANQSDLMDDYLTYPARLVPNANLSPLYESPLSILETYGEADSEVAHGS